MKIELFYILLYTLLLIFKIDSLAQITISEVMFDVSTNESHDEFIEIFNLSEIDSVDVTGWSFSDSSGSDEIITYSGSTKIGPRSFAVILDGSYLENSNAYDSIIPDSVVIFTIDNRTFGSSGLSNSKGEYLSIINAKGDTLSAYRYSVGNKPGFSDEKIILDGKNDRTNWNDSKVEGGTPGFKNSITPLDWDLGFEDSSLNIPPLMFENDSIQIEVLLYNYGLKAVDDSIEVLCFLDKDADIKYGEKDILIEKKYLYLKEWFEHTFILFHGPYLPAGEHLIVINLNYPRDQNSENDIISKNITVLMRSSNLHINEIKFLTLEDEPEWIEVVNIGNGKIYLKNWALADMVDTVTIDTQVAIWPGQFKVFSADSISQFYVLSDSLIILMKHFLTLNNSSDAISLLEPGGMRNEKIRYNISWLEGRENHRVSLERINPLLYENKAENWGPSMAGSGATPGEENSIYSDLQNKEAFLYVNPNPFSPDADGIEDVAIISGELPETSARIKVQIFNIKGYLVRTLHDNYFTGSRFNIIWDGRDDQGRIARMGIYIIFVQALNDWHGIIRELKATVVLAQKL